MPRNESRRSFRYTGGVTRGWEDHTSGKLVPEKRGSPITPKFALRVIRFEGRIASIMPQNFWGVFVRKMLPAQNP